MDPTVIGCLVRSVGLALAVLGIVLANPAAARRFGASLTRPLVVFARRVREVLARVFPSLHREPETSSASGSGVIRITGSARGTAPFVEWEPTDTIERKFDLLAEQTRQLYDEALWLHRRIDKVESGQRSGLAEVDRRLRSETADLRGQVRQLREESVQADAAALPVAISGLILSELSSDIPHWWAWVGWLLLLIGCAVFYRFSRRLVRDWEGLSS